GETQQREQRQRVIVEGTGQKRGLAAAPFHAEQQGPQHAHALVAAGEPIEFEQKGVKQHAERQGQHAEEDFGVANAQGADHQCDQPGCHRRRDQQQLETEDAEFRGQHRVGIGADAEKQRVPEGQQPGGAEQQIEAEQRDAVADERQHQQQRVTRGDQRQQRHDGDQPQQDPQAVGPERPPRHRRRRDVDRGMAHAVTFPNSPAGRTISTTTTTRYTDSISSSGISEIAAARINPTTRAPTSAPRMLPSPPITTTAKDSTTRSTAISSDAAPEGTTSAPPTVPSMQPTVNTSAKIFEALTPSPSAMSRFSPVARPIRP